MKEIGGYFELELRRGKEYHPNAIKLNSGRNCLEYILRARGYKKIFIPYFTCEVILEPIQKLGLSYEFYSIDEHLDPILNTELKTEEVLLYTNYFGIKTAKTKELATTINNLVIDNSQAFFSKPIEGVDTFYSARKFFGVPDGAYLYTTAILEEEFEVDKSFERFSHLLKRIDSSASSGYTDFKNNDLQLSQQPIKFMSKLTSSILCSIDYATVISDRKRNFEFFHKILIEKNKLKIDIFSDDVPLVYPFSHKSELRETLIKNNIFIATYWPNVIEWVEKDSLEYKLTKNLIHLPIDQRVRYEDLLFIIQLIK